MFNKQKESALRSHQLQSTIVYTTDHVCKPSQKITAVQALLAVMQHVLFHVRQVTNMVSSAHQFLGVSTMRTISH